MLLMENLINICMDDLWVPHDLGNLQMIATKGIIAIWLTSVW